MHIMKGKRAASCVGTLLDLHSFFEKFINIAPAKASIRKNGCKNFTISREKFAILFLW